MSQIIDVSSDLGDEGRCAGLCHLNGLGFDFFIVFFIGENFGKNVS